MDFTNKLIYIYDTQKWNMTIFKQYEEKKKGKKNQTDILVLNHLHIYKLLVRL